MVRVLVVDDSAFMRKMISDLLGEDPRIEVVATARNGKDALEKIQQLQPDVVTLDVEMPIMNGLDALKQIMQTIPKPVIMVSSTTKEGAENTVLAMSYGAVDFIAKPSGAISLDLHKVREELIEKVVLASSVKLAKLLPAPIREVKSQSQPVQHQEKAYRKKLQHKKVIAIGTSTGGPKALQQVITKLPENLNAPVLIVQHMPPGFTKSLATRLDSLSKISVKEAEDGEIIKKGVAYIAPGGYHLKIRSIGTTLAIQLDQSPPENGHRPSVDTMLTSLASISNYSVIAVIMTGMGSDGSKGLVTLKHTGDVVAIAEAEDSSVVFGMPRAAIKTNKVDEVVHLNDIAASIEKYC